MNIVVALGGNAILQRGERGTAEEQFGHVSAAVREIAWLIERGDNIIITHGNGPQVGDLLLKDECAREQLPPMPLDIIGAESQGMIGYMIQQSLENELRSRGIVRSVITCITQTLVDPADPAFLSPTKPIGPFYTEKDAARLREERGWHIHEVGSGPARFRRVVASPTPLGIVEHPSLKTLYMNNFVVIAAGGGGIPVYRSASGELAGIEAVVDKDLAAERLATGIGAGHLLILTDVPCIYRNFRTPRQKPIASLSADEAAALLAEGQFGEGSMAPKVEACIRFLRAGGQSAVITSLALVRSAVDSSAGTRIIP